MSDDNEYKKDREEPYKADMRTMVLTLTVSLFIAMLAFFMILNSYSSISTQRLATMKDSLQNAFGFIGVGNAVTASDEEGRGSAGDMEQAAAAGLRSVLPDLGFQSRRTASGGTIMSVSIPRADFSERWADLRIRLGDLMVNRNGGGKYVLQILALDGPAQAAALAPIAVELEEEGVDADQISVGYEDRRQAAIELRFIQGR